uniref:Chromosome 1 open reading frame 105 n=1 Tax=Prolemur simus TaxID=1328070 RepID=A0A8C8Z8C2_PROSS
MEEMRPTEHGTPNVCIHFELANHSFLPGLCSVLTSFPNRSREGLLGGQASANSESEARRNQSDSILLRNQQLCSTCQEINTVQPRTMIIPDDLKLSFDNFMSRRMKSPHQPKAQSIHKPSHDDISEESVRYRLPMLGPRTAAFHGLLSDAYKTLQEMQPTSLPKKEPMGKTTRK